MLPILANIVTGPKEKLSRLRAVCLSSLYVVSMATSYAIAGLIAGLGGQYIPNLLQSWPILTISGLFLLLMAAIQADILPVNLSSTLNSRFPQGSILGAISLGMISVLILSPCITPALIAALVYVGQAGQTLIGALSLFAIGLGQGIPLMAVVLLGYNFLPKSGEYMKYIKYAIASILVLFAGSTFIKAYDVYTSETKTTIQANNKQGTGGAHNPKKSAIIPQIKQTTIYSIAQLNSIVKSNPKVVVEFTAAWCSACRTQKPITESLRGVTVVYVDLTASSAWNSELARKFHIVGVPTMITYHNGVQTDKFVGVTGAGTLNAALNR